MDAAVTRMFLFCVSVCYKNRCGGYADVFILRIRMLQKWRQWLHGCFHFAYPYATKMEAVDTRMLRFCVSVCYRNRCSGYTVVSIFAYQYATRLDAVVAWKLTFCASVCYKNGCSGYTDVNIFAYPYATRLDAVVTRMLAFLRIRMLQKWMQWLHGS